MTRRRGPRHRGGHHPTTQGWCSIATSSKGNRMSLVDRVQRFVVTTSLRTPIASVCRLLRGGGDLRAESCSFVNVWFRILTKFSSAGHTWKDTSLDCRRVRFAIVGGTGIRRTSSSRRRLPVRLTMQAYTVSVAVCGAAICARTPLCTPHRCVSPVWIIPRPRLRGLRRPHVSSSFREALASQREG